MNFTYSRVLIYDKAYTNLQISGFCTSDLHNSISEYPHAKHFCLLWRKIDATSQWRRNERDGVSNHQPYDCLLNCLLRRRPKKTSKLRVNGLYKRNSLVIGEFPSQKASNAENVSIWWRINQYVAHFCPWMLPLHQVAHKIYWCMKIITLTYLLE